MNEQIYYSSATITFLDRNTNATKVCMAYPITQIILNDYDTKNDTVIPNKTFVNKNGKWIETNNT